MADALPFADFRTMVTYGWDSARPVDQGFWPLVKYLVMKFIVLTVLVFANLQQICYGVRLGLGSRRDEPVRKATTDLIEPRLGVGTNTSSFCWAPCGPSSLSGGGRRVTTVSSTRTRRDVSIRKPTTHLIQARLESGTCWIRDYHLNRDDEGNHRPYANCRYARVKQRNGVRPYERRDEYQWLTITCTCNGQHAPLVIRWTVKGLPKGGVIQGNVECWYNLFRFCTEHSKGEPASRLLQHWNMRERKFGRTNYAKKVISRALQTFGEYSRGDDN